MLCASKIMRMQFSQFILLFLFSWAAGEILIEDLGDGFTVSFDGITILSHTQENPLFSVGAGEFEAIYHQGNYDITDNASQNYPLNDYSIVYGVNEDFIHLSSSVVSNIGMVLRLAQVEDGNYEIEPDYQAYPNLQINRFFMNVLATDEEKVFGAGEQFSYLNLRGRDYPIWVREQGVGRNKSSELTQYEDANNDGAGGDYHTTYWPQPTFLSTRRYYFEMNLHTYSELRFGAYGEPFHQIYWHRNHVSGQVCRDCTINIRVRSSLMSIVQSINPGRAEIPDWVYNGAILGVQGGTDKMLEYLEQADNASAAISGMWIQDWSGKIITDFGTRVFWNWRWNETWYPGLDTVIQDLKARDVRVLVYITPHLNVDGDVYQSMENDDIWMSRTNGERLLLDFGEFNVSTIDLMLPDPDCGCVNPARETYKNLMKTNILDLDISGWMADFGEYIPTDARTKFPQNWWGALDQEEILHQSVSESWASLNDELLKENNEVDDTLIFMRSGGVTSKNYSPINWAGDQTVDWTQSDGLMSSIIAALSLATQGFGVSYSDIGGYTAETGEFNLTRTKELLLRWAEYSAFTPVMRTHEGNRPNDNHQVYSDEDTFMQFGRLTRIYRDMKDYIKQAVEQNKNEKKPVMRPLFLDFESDALSFDQEYEYMFGDDLLVAPVLQPGVDKWTVYLPETTFPWVWLWDDLELPYQGPAFIEVDAVLGETPAFYKLGSTWTNLFRSINQQYSLSNN